MADNKIFIGYTKVIKTKHGDIVAISLSEADKKLLSQYTNEAGYTNIKIMNKINGGKYTEIDTWGIGKVQENGDIVATKVEPKVNEEPDEIILDEIPW